MRQKIFLVILFCLFCSGCKTFDSFVKKGETIPVITAEKPQSETETVWVPAKTNKVWVNAHIDDEGSMIDGHYKFVILEEGHWALQEIAPEAKHQQKQNAVAEEMKHE